MAFARVDPMAGFDEDDSDDESGSPGVQSAQISCELPSARSRRLAFGGDDDRVAWTCPICPLTDHTAKPERLPPCIEDFREALTTQPRQLPEIEACEALSDMFNRTCYELDRTSVRPAGIRPMTPRDVQKHLRHVRHLPANEDNMLDDCLLYALEARQQLEKQDLWFANADGEATLNRKGFAQWCKAVDTLKKLVELRHRFHGPFPLRQGDGGVHKRRARPRQAFPVVR
jgi:hypothetical protein